MNETLSKTNGYRRKSVDREAGIFAVNRDNQNCGLFLGGKCLQLHTVSLA
jgi:hypothetical protein